MALDKNKKFIKPKNNRNMEDISKSANITPIRSKLTPGPEPNIGNTKKKPKSSSKKLSKGNRSNSNSNMSVSKKS
jgi:hypothetical protein